MKAPSFYCENCGREVNPNLNICPGCGEKFISVRCPSCGFTGESYLFNKKCPQCGFSGADSDNLKKDGNLYNKNVKETGKYFPSWLYKVLIGILVVVILGIIRFYYLL